MDELRKSAYRYLLYRAMLDLRGIRWLFDKPGSLLRVDKWQYYRDTIKELGELADWLHNLALFAANDFERFEEDRFWKENEYFVNSSSNHTIYRYRSIFEEHLAELVKKHSSDH
jgi:hypothetical protein